MKKLINGIYSWSWFSQERNYNFNGFYVEDEAGPFLVDPVEPTEEDLGWIDEQGAPKGILITNRHHTRKVDLFADRYRALVYMPEAEAGGLDLRVHKTLHPADSLPWACELISLPGKTPGEVGLYFPQLRVVLVGDAVIGDPPGSLRLLPESKLKEPARLKQSVARLLDYDFDALLVGDGEHVLEGAKAKLEALVKTWKG